MVIYEANVTLILHGVKANYKKQIENAQEVPGFAKIYSYGQQDSTYFMTMELLGPSLADLFQFCGYRFSLKTTLMLAY